MTEESSNKNYLESDLQESAAYEKYWTRKQTHCNWTNKSLHWHHCDKETMDQMPSTLPNIQKVLISIGNTLSDSIIHNDYELQKLNIILNQQNNGEGIEQKQKATKTEQINSKEEITALKEQIASLQNDLTSLRIHELSKLRKLTEQNQQVISMMKSIDIRKLENTVYELNEKIPTIEPLLKEFDKMFKILENISRAIGYEE